MIKNPYSKFFENGCTDEAVERAIESAKLALEMHLYLRYSGHTPITSKWQDPIEDPIQKIIEMQEYCRKNILSAFMIPLEHFELKNCDESIRRQVRRDYLMTAGITVVDRLFIF